MKTINKNCNEIYVKQKRHSFFLKNTFHPTTSQDRKKFIEGIICYEALEIYLKKSLL